jgi:hypothetical protein
VIQDQDKQRFNDLTKAIDDAKAECDRTYAPWREACDRLKSLERERTDVWRRMIDDLRR